MRSKADIRLAWLRNHRSRGPLSIALTRRGPRLINRPLDQKAQRAVAERLTVFFAYRQ
jgi:hypothetical protein